MSSSNDPVVRGMEQRWHKLCAIALYKLGVTELTLTIADIKALTNSGRSNIVVDTRGGATVTLRLVSDSERAALIQEHGELAHEL